MTHLKILGLAAMAAMALMAIVTSSASATALYTTTGMVSPGSSIDFSLKANLKSKRANTAGTETLGECSISTIKGKTSNTGSATETVKISFEEWTWEGCTVPTSTDVKGGFEIHWIPGTTNGTVTALSEAGWTENTIFFGICRYGVAAGTHLGVLTGSTAGTAEIHVNAVVSKQAGSEAVCPSTNRWTATYVSTTPDSLWVEES